jgi:hypothetical protein
MTADRQLDWPEVARLLAPWRNYWVGTTGTDGAPQASPVWGVVVDGGWYAYTERTTVKARNLAFEPRVTVHLESGDDVLIVRGRLDPSTDPTVLAGVEAAFAAKYDDPDDLEYLPHVTDTATVFYALTPTAAATWELASFDDTQRRWTA